MATDKLPDLFTVYYMNQQKVFETRMLLDNQLKTSASSEEQKSSGKSAAADIEAEFNPPLLTRLKTKVSGEISSEKQQKVVDTLEYVNTKSRLLYDIMKRCKVYTHKDEFSEGDLVYIGNISLELLNEEEVRGILTIMNGTLDGIALPEVGGLDIGHMMQSFVKNSASFKLKGSAADGTLYAKIPIDGDEMFESKYTIDDLLIGKVGIVGIYKGDLEPNELKSPLDYFQQSGKTKPASSIEVVECGGEPTAPIDSDKATVNKKGFYIDVMAIIQAVTFKKD
ncbi:hypothetical protein [uncultured Slackia sp.]|uniref:hypothetical protein n=1 Tax=uncultured Slackia sp. TaxID=665903 RepID=UPI0025D5F05A|nr:hypothetical protein [uncultured Slackia sp.]